MKLDDKLLLARIESDMLQKGVKRYAVSSDEIISSDIEIQVKSNEVAYLCFFSMENISDSPFNISFSSASGALTYNQFNTCKRIFSEGEERRYFYESSVVNSHFSTIKLTVESAETSNFYFRVVKVTFQN